MGRSSPGPSRFVRAPFVQVTGLSEIDEPHMSLAFAQLPARMSQAAKKFRELTGLTVVTALTRERRDIGSPESLAPPIHPLCADLLQSVRSQFCERNWRQHVREGLESPYGHSHVCPLGLQCACVPIYMGPALVGMAKLVTDRSTASADFRAALATLALTLSLSCHEAYTTAMRHELKTLRQRMARLSSVGGTSDTTARPDFPIRSDGVLHDALEYLDQRYRQVDLSLRAVAAAVGCNPRYLTYLFTKVVGQRMRSYIAGLRVSHACRQLLGTDQAIKQIAFDSGFRDPGHLSRVFRQVVGVSPSEYRRAFARCSWSEAAGPKTVPIARAGIEG